MFSERPALLLLTSIINDLFLYLHYRGFINYYNLSAVIKLSSNSSEGILIELLRCYSEKDSRLHTSKINKELGYICIRL